MARTSTSSGGDDDFDESAASSVRTSRRPAQRAPRPKIYSCEYCERRFDRPSLLSQHVLIHTGERPHLCPRCNTKRFSRTSNLYRHMRTCKGVFATTGLTPPPPEQTPLSEPATLAPDPEDSPVFSERASLPSLSRPTSPQVMLSSAQRVPSLPQLSMRSAGSSSTMGMNMAWSAGGGGNEGTGEGPGSSKRIRGLSPDPSWGPNPLASWRPAKRRHTLPGGTLSLHQGASGPTITMPISRKVFVGNPARDLINAMQSNGVGGGGGGGSQLSTPPLEESVSPSGSASGLGLGLGSGSGSGGSGGSGSGSSISPPVGAGSGSGSGSGMETQRQEWMSMTWGTQQQQQQSSSDTGQNSFMSYDNAQYYSQNSTFSPSSTGMGGYTPSGSGSGLGIGTTPGGDQMMFDTQTPPHNQQILTEYRWDSEAVAAVAVAGNSGGSGVQQSSVSSAALPHRTLTANEPADADYNHDDTHARGLEHTDAGVSASSASPREGGVGRYRSMTMSAARDVASDQESGSGSELSWDKYLQPL